MFTLRTVAIVVTGAGMFASLPLTDAQACDDDRFPCPVVSEAAPQESANAPAKPAPSAQPRKKANNPAVPEKKAQSKVERDARPTATRTKASKPAVQESASAPIAQQPSISPNAAETAPAVVSPSAADQAAKEVNPNEGLVAAAGAVWPALANADGVSTTGAKGADAAQAAPANAVRAIDANEFGKLDRADIATTPAKSSWITYLLLILGATLAAASAMWFLPRMTSMYARRAAGARIHINS